MQFAGIMCGIASLISVFLHWERYIGPNSVYPAPISYFLGIENRSIDRVFGLDFLPIACTLIFILGFSLAKKHIAWRIIAFFGSLVCTITGGYSFLFYMLSDKVREYRPGLGLRIFAASSLLALVLSILILIKKRSIGKEAI